MSIDVQNRAYRDPNYADPHQPLEPNVVRAEPNEGLSGSSWSMIAGSLAAIALIFGLAFYFNGDGDGGANIATNKNPAGMSQPATTGSGASTTGSGATAR